MNLERIWEQAQTSIQAKVGKASYDTWFAALKVKTDGNNVIILETPDDFFKNWIVEHYKDLLENILSELSQNKIVLEFTVNSNIVGNDTHARLSQLEKGFRDVTTTSSKLNERFTFDNFVVGSSNRLACAASLAVAESPAKAYNPLFIYGPVGLGKTHLIQAITHKIIQFNNSFKMCYLSSEQFTNELIDAIRKGSTAQFRNKYRNMDVLLIDDIQFIAGKESTQEEFFHTFNELHNNRKQIIITSDKPPKDITNLEERLKTRFLWGLTVDIQAPDFETRVAILHKKIEHEPIKIPDDVIYFIADQIKSNIRELEGALIRVAAYSLLEDKPITLELTKLILKDMVQETSKVIGIDVVQKKVADFYKIALADLRSKRRNKNIVLPRQIAMYLSRQLTNLSLPEIGNAFGGKDHTTVLHSCKKIEDLILKDEDIRFTVTLLSNLIKQ